MQTITNLGFLQIAKIAIKATQGVVGFNAVQQRFLLHQGFNLLLQERQTARVKTRRIVIFIEQTL